MLKKNYTHKRTISQTKNLFDNDQTHWVIFKTLPTIVSTSKSLLSSFYKDAFHCFDKSFHAICL